MISASELIPSTAGTRSQRLRYSLGLRFAGVTVNVRTDELALIEALSEKYTEHICTAHDDLEFYVARTLGGYRFWSTAGGAWEWNQGSLPADALAFLTDAALLSTVIRSDNDLRSIHAAAIEHAGAGAAIVGDSTAGKTTTFLACARAGARIFSDERALLRGTALQPFLRSCTVRDGGKTLLLNDEPDDALARTLKRSQVFDLRDSFGPESLAEPVALKTVFILGGRSDAAVAKRIDHTEALAAVTKWFDMRGGMLERISCALNLLSSIKCYALQMGTPADTARTILSTLELQA